MNKIESRILGLVYAALLTLGAASKESLVTETGLTGTDVSWALWQFKCCESAELHTLPDAMMPSGWAVTEVA